MKEFLIYFIFGACILALGSKIVEIERVLYGTLEAKDLAQISQLAKKDARIKELEQASADFEARLYEMHNKGKR